MQNDWVEILLKVNVKDVDLASDIATMTVPYGFYIEDYSDLEQGAREIAHIDLIDEELLKKDREHAVIHIYIEPDENPNEAIDFLKIRLDAANVEYSIDTDNISEDDWANSWKKYFKPIEIGERLLVLPEWEPAPDTDRAILKLDPGAAFGTGTHATTKLCLQILDKSVKGGETVLDIGCGSGILSIAAMLLGAKNATGVDIDALAVKTAKQNAVMNGFDEPQFTAVQGDLADKISGKFDICVANIVADVIIRLCNNVADFMNDGALFITSGIIDSRADEVYSALCGAGFEVQERFESAGWVAFIAKTAVKN